MSSPGHGEYSIRQAQLAEFSLLGQLTVDAYASLLGMPTPAEQPDYYELLRDVGRRAHNPGDQHFRRRQQFRGATRLCRFHR